MLSRIIFSALSYKSLKMFKVFGQEGRIRKDYFWYQSDPSRNFRIWTGYGSTKLSTGLYPNKKNSSRTLPFYCTILHER
jgi:hypothetical protein